MTGENRCTEFGHGSMRALRAEIVSDIRRFMTKSEASRAAPDDTLHRVSAFLTPQILAQALHRTAHLLYVRQYRRIACVLTRANSFLHKVNIPPQSCIGPGLHIPHPCGITFCGSAGEGCTLYSMATCGADLGYADGPLQACPHLGDRVTVAAHEALLGRIRIGDDVKTGLFLYRLDFDVPDAVIVTARVRRPVQRRQAVDADAFSRSGGQDGVA